MQEQAYEILNNFILHQYKSTYKVPALYMVVHSLPWGIQKWESLFLSSRNWQYEANCHSGITELQGKLVNTILKYQTMEVSLEVGDGGTLWKQHGLWVLNVTLVGKVIRKKLKYDPAFPLLYLIPEMKIHIHIKLVHQNIHSNVVHNSRKVETTKCPSTDEWLNKMWYVHIIEY